MAESRTSAPFAYLTDEQFVSLTTLRRDGRGVPTPVWFAAKDGYVYVFTSSGSGKVKRIRNDGRVTLAPCTAAGQVTGPEVAGTAHIIADAQEIAKVEALMDEKYGEPRRQMLAGQSPHGRADDQATYIAIAPPTDA